MAALASPATFIKPNAAEACEEGRGADAGFYIYSLFAFAKHLGSLSYRPGPTLQGPLQTHHKGVLQGHGARSLNPTPDKKRTKKHSENVQQLSAARSSQAVVKQKQ